MKGITYIDNDILKICIAVGCMILVMLFILEIAKRIFAHQLRNKALELRVSEELASAVLKEKPGAGSKASIKWSFIFAGLGIGATLVHYTQPFGFHSLALIAFSLAAAFFGHFLYLKQFGN